MSNEIGGKAAAADMLREAKALVDDAEAAEQEQLDLLAEPLTAEEVALAQEALGASAGRMTVLRQARENRKVGRTPGSRNRRTDDFIRYISQFGPDPAVVMMQIAGESEEAMLERSYANDPVKRRLSWGDARAMRIRAAEALLPYFHGKQPVKVDATIRGVVVVEEFGSSHGAGITIDADPLGLLPMDDEGEG
jgi:hypothetical protein